MIIDVIIPTLKKPHAFEAIASLKYLPFPIRLHLITEGDKWAEAINLGLCEAKGDVLLMDDDITLLPFTFKDFDKYYHDADIFGFKLLFPDGKIQHGGGMINLFGFGHYGYGKPQNECSEPQYLAHCTASLLFIKRYVIEKIGLMASDWPGDHFEDVDFSLRAIKEGFKILYIPNPAIHHETASKKDNGNFEINHKILRSKWFRDIAVMEDYPKPYAEAIQ